MPIPSVDFGMTSNPGDHSHILRAAPIRSPVETTRRVVSRRISPRRTERPERPERPGYELRARGTFHHGVDAPPESLCDEAGARRMPISNRTRIIPSLGVCIRLLHSRSEQSERGATRPPGRPRREIRRASSIGHESSLGAVSEAKQPHLRKRTQAAFSQRLKAKS